MRRGHEFGREGEGKDGHATSLTSPCDLTPYAVHRTGLTNDKEPNESMNKG